MRRGVTASEHRGMLNHLCAKVIDLKLTEADVVAQNASQCFDISVWQYLAALLIIHVLVPRLEPAQIDAGRGFDVGPAT